MLVVHSSSSCDVCLEGYDGSTKTPHAISCGHVFCLACLQSLNRRQCPLCRATFEIPEVRRLHLDRSPGHSTSTSSSIPSTAVPDAAGEGTEDHMVRHYQGAITRIVRDGDIMSTVRGTIDEIRSWLRTQPEDQHINLRASFLLLYRSMEYQAKNKSLELEVEKLEEEIHTTEASCESLRAQIKAEAEAANTKYDELLRTSHEERLRAVSMEKSKRDHAEKMEREWREKYEKSASECKRLQALVDHLKRNPLPPPPMPVEEHAMYLSDDSASSEDGQKTEALPSPEPVLPIRLATGLPRALDAEERFRLSPVPPTPIGSEDVFNALKTDNEAERKASVLLSPRQPHTPARQAAVPASPATVSQEVTNSPNLSRTLPRISHTELAHKNRSRRRDRSNSVQETGTSSYGNLASISGSSRGNSVSALRTPLPPPPGDGVPHEHLRGQLYDLLDQKPKHTSSSPAYAILHFATPTISRTALPRARSTQVLNPPTPKMHGSPIIQARPLQRRRNTASAGMGGVDTYALPYTSPPPPPPPLPTLGKDKSQTYERPAVLSSASGAALAAEQRRRELRNSESSQGQTPKVEHREVYPIVTPPPAQPSHARSQSQPNTLQRRPSGGSSKGKGRPQLPPTGLDLWTLSV